MILSILPAPPIHFAAAGCRARCTPLLHRTQADRIDKHFLIREMVRGAEDERGGSMFVEEWVDEEDGGRSREMRV